MAAPGSNSRFPRPLVQHDRPGSGIFVSSGAKVFRPNSDSPHRVNDLASPAIGRQDASVP